MVRARVGVGVSGSGALVPHRAPAHVESALDAASHHGRAAHRSEGTRCLRLRLRLRLLRLRLLRLRLLRLRRLRRLRLWLWLRLRRRL